MKIKLLTLLIGVLFVFENYAQQNLIQNGGFEEGISPAGQNKVHYATGWSNGCGLLLLQDNSIIDGTPDLCDRAFTTSGGTFDVPSFSLEARNHSATTPNNRFAHMLPAMRYNEYPQYYGESIKGTITEALSENYAYSVSCYAARRYWSGNTPILQFEFVLRKDNDCDLEKLVYTSPNIPYNSSGSGTSNWTLISGTFVPNQADVANGFNKLEIRIKGEGGSSHDMYVDDVSMTKRPASKASFVFSNPNQTQKTYPSYYGPMAVTEICETPPKTCVTINGSASVNEDRYYIHITEFDLMSWTDVGTPLWDNWVCVGCTVPSFKNLCDLTNLTGSTFLPGKLYKVALSVGPDWDTDIKFIKINPTPVANAGIDKTICQGECVTIGTTGSLLNTYSWSNNNGVIVGTTSQITVCPNSTTTYKLKVSNKYGCNTQDQVVVNVVSNNPDFTITTPITGSNTFNIFANPVVTNANTVAGFGDMYMVEELDANNNAIASASVYSNPSCWWVYPNSQKFRAYVGSSSVNCFLTMNGVFSTSKVYRITRGTWNSYCDWQSVSKIVRMSSRMSITEGGEGQFTIIEDDNAPDFSHLKNHAASSETISIPSNEINIYPNPTSGKFNIEFGNSSSGKVTVFDALGKVVSENNITANSGNLNLNLSDYPAGIYFVKVNAGEEIIMKKLIKQ